MSEGFGGGPEAGEAVAEVRADVVAVPRPSYLAWTFWVAISIGASAAAVGAYYITLTTTIAHEKLGPFLGVLAGCVLVSIGVMYSVHRRLTQPVLDWLRRPSDDVPSEAWIRSLNYSLLMAASVGLAAFGVTAGAALFGMWQSGLRFALQVLIGGLLAALLDATFAYLYMDYAMRRVSRAMSSRQPLLPVRGEGIVALGLGGQMGLVIVNASVVGAVVSGTLAHRGATLMLQEGGDLGWLAIRIVLVTLVGLGVTLGGCLLVARHATGPISDMAELLKTLDPETYHRRYPVAGTNEVARLGVTVNEMLAGLEERELIKDAFGRYLARQVSDIILQGRLELGGELLTVTILMSDIRGFTPLSESLPPQEVVRLLNRYFTSMVEVIMENGGVVDKFIGDAIMVIFGAPVKRTPEESAMRAVRSAIGMRERLRELNESFEAEGLPAIRVGIGVHTGEAIVGNVGSSQRMDYTCIGDSVNTTARIESACKTVGADVLVSGVVRTLLGNRIEVGPSSRVHLKGKSEPMDVFPVEAVLDDSGLITTASARSRSD